MPWTKLKNIILIVLVIANLCLLALVIGPAYQSRRQMEQARAEAIQFLRSQGVQVEDSTVPQSMDLLPQTVERDLEGEERAAAALLGSGVTAEARGGEVYRYFNENGSVQFHSDGAISAQLEPSAFPLGEDQEAGCLALMEKMGIQGTIPGRVNVSHAENAFMFQQSWEGTPLSTQLVTLECREGGLSAITTGRLLLASPQPDPARRTITVATALIAFLNGVNGLGDVCNRIDAIQPGYTAAASLSGPTVLTPVWRLTTDTGAYQLDTVTGAVTRVS